VTGLVRGFWAATGRTTEARTGAASQWNRRKEVSFQNGAFLIITGESFLPSKKHESTTEMIHKIVTPFLQERDRSPRIVVARKTS